MTTPGSSAAGPSPSAGPPPSASPSAVSAVADRGQVALGAPFHVTIEVLHDPELRYELAPAQAPGPFAILGGDCATRAGALDGETRCDIELALLDVGRHSAVLRLRPSGGRGDAPVVEVGASPVQALSVTDPATPASAIALRGMPAPVPLYVPTWEPLAWIALGASIALAIAVLLVRHLREQVRTAERRRGAQPRLLTPSEAFEERLDALDAAVAAAPDAPGPPPFFELSHALRSYLAALSPGATLDRTSRELLSGLRRRPIGGLDLDRLAALLAELDRARFAGALGGDDAWRGVLAGARAVLDTTRPPRWDPDREARSA